MLHVHGQKPKHNWEIAITQAQHAPKNTLTNTG